MNIRYRNAVFLLFFSLLFFGCSNKVGRSTDTYDYSDEYSDNYDLSGYNNDEDYPTTEACFKINEQPIMAWNVEDGTSFETTFSDECTTDEYYSDYEEINMLMTMSESDYISGEQTRSITNTNQQSTTTNSPPIINRPKPTDCDAKYPCDEIRIECLPKEVCPFPSCNSNCVIKMPVEFCDKIIPPQDGQLGNPRGLIFKTDFWENLLDNFGNHKDITESNIFEVCATYHEYKHSRQDQTCPSCAREKNGYDAEKACFDKAKKTFCDTKKWSKKTCDEIDTMMKIDNTFIDYFNCLCDQKAVGEENKGKYKFGACKECRDKIKSFTLKQQEKIESLYCKPYEIK